MSLQMRVVQKGVGLRDPAPEYFTSSVYLPIGNSNSPPRPGNTLPPALSALAATLDLTVPAARGLALLTKEQADALSQCESRVCRALHGALDAGAALKIIREKGLFRGTHKNFAIYCRERFGIGISYASRLIAAAERVALLPADNSLPLPANECQVRPLLRVPQAQFLEAWREVAKRAGGRQITCAVVTQVALEICPLPQARAIANPTRPQVPTQPRVTSGELQGLLREARARIEKLQSGKAIAALDRIERLLFGELAAGGISHETDATDIERTAHRLRLADDGLFGGIFSEVQELVACRLLQPGITYKEIGLQLGIAEQTVRQHTRAVCEELGVSGKKQATAVLLQKMRGRAVAGRGEGTAGSRRRAATRK
jgi:hypothetical protein